MEKAHTIRKFNWITLQPNDQNLRKEFSKFRIDDIMLMFKYICVIKGVMWLTSGVAAIRQLYPQSTEYFLLQTTIVILSLVTLVIGLRFRKQLIWMLPTSYIIELLLIILISLILEDAEYMGINAIMNEIYFTQMTQACLTFTVFLSPSIAFMFFY